MALWGEPNAPSIHTIQHQVYIFMIASSDFTVDLLWWGLLRLAPIIYEKQIEQSTMCN